MGTNGLTSARHDVFDHSYATKYPDSFDHNTPDEVVYVGSKKLTDTININGQEMTIGKLVLSPTRTYLPIIKRIIDELKGEIQGMIHCTGGAQTKAIKFVEGVNIVKDNLFPTPPLFEMIQKESGTSWKEMYQVLNMGQRLEVYVAPDKVDILLDIAKSFQIDAQVVGYVEASANNKVTIKSPYGVFEYFD